MGGLIFNDLEVVVVSFGGPGRLVPVFVENVADYFFGLEGLGKIRHELIHDVRYYISVLISPLNSYMDLALFVNKSR